jgi:hypothetical protein
MATLTPVDHDPFAAPTGPSLVPVDGDPFKGEKAIPIGAKQQPKVEQTTGVFGRLLQEFRNTVSAAGQRVTPDIESHMPYLISDETMMAEDGSLEYRDPATGQVLQADSNKHNVLRDPRDGRLKIFARSESTEEGLLPSAGRILMSGTGSGQVAQKAIQTVARAAPIVSEGQRVAEAGERIGVQLPRAVTSDTTAVQHLGGIAANIPIGGTPLRTAATKAISDLDAAAQRTQAAYGSGSAAAAGAGAREGITEFVKSGPIKQRVDELYSQVDNLVDAAATGPLVNTNNIVRTIDARRANAALPKSGVTGELQEALARPGMNYEGVKNLRTYFGEMLDGSIPIPQGMTHAEVKQVYGALSQDMRLIIARAGGPEALNAYQRAERAAARWAQIREDLGKLLKVQNEEGIFDRIVAMAGSTARADVNLLGRVRGAVGPQHWDEIASAAIARMGRTAGGTDFSPDAFLTAFKKLSDEGKRMLFRSTNHASHADALDDIAKVSERFKRLNQFKNPSGTGQVVAGVVGAGGLWVDPISAVGSIASARILSHILAKPATARQMSAWANAYERAIVAPSAASTTAFQRSSGFFASGIAREVGRPDLADDLTRQLQGTVPGRAEEDARQ